MNAVAPILIVDDDEDIRETMALVLLDAGYATVQAWNGADALMRLATMPVAPRLILLDLMMPQMNGVEFLAVLAGGPCRPPVVIMTAASIAGSHVGGVEMVRKPFTIEALLDVVTRYGGAP